LDQQVPPLNEIIIQILLQAIVTLDAALLFC
jgi:hypothetical protein